MNQFDIATHYDVMEQLDAVVHKDTALAISEVDLALELIGFIPETVFLPCCGTGRHVIPLINKGVTRVVGVDLSPASIRKAALKHTNQDDKVQFHHADMLSWKTNETFDAVLLLGNSFGDLIQRKLLLRFIGATLAPLRKGGKFVMDYIGEHYLEHALSREKSSWSSEYKGEHVKDVRIPRYDFKTGVMSIDVEISGSAGLLWSGGYQKLIATHNEVIQMFRSFGMIIKREGQALDLNKDYYSSNGTEMGMIALSDWWIGQKIH